MTRSLLPWREALTTLSLILVAAGPVHAQRFGEEISITEVEVPVHVLQGGEPVRGLTADDFEVLDDGEPREIIAFRVIDLTRLEDEAPGEARPTEGAPGEPGPVADVEGRRILLFFDLLFSRAHYLERALLGAREMVAGQLHPADRVAVAYLTGGGSNLILGFTDDRDEIEAALAAVQAILERRPAEVREHLARIHGERVVPEGPAGSAEGDRDATAGSSAAGAGEGGSPGDATGPPRPSRAAELAQRLGPAAAVTVLSGAAYTGQGGLSATTGQGGAFDLMFDPVSAGSGEPSIDPVSSRVAYDDPEQIGSSFAAHGQTSAIRTLSHEVGRLSTLLRDVPGQKQLLYLSQGFSSAILNDFASSSRALVLRYLERMFESLRRAGWTLHAMDVEGVPDPFGGRGFDADALFYMANETGGLLFENYNRIHQATRKLVERTSVTYVLTIRPGPLPADGSLHRLDVRLKKDLGWRTRVLHRTGYYAPKPAAEKTALEQQLDTVDLLLGKREIEELGTRILAGTLPPAGGPAGLAAGLVPVPVVVEVPVGDLLAERITGSLDLELQLYAVDSRDGVQDLWLRNLRLDLDEVGDTLARGGLRVLGGMTLPPGDYRLRTLVRDLATGRTSLSTTPLSVPADGGGLLPMQPVVIDRSGDWLELVALPSGPGGVPRQAFSLGPTAVVPPVAPMVRRDDWLEFMVVTAGEEVELSGRLLDAEGRELAGAGSVSFVDRLEAEEAGLGQHLTRHLGRAVLARLEPGRYRLEVSASGPGAAEAASRSLPFEVVE